VEPIHLRPTAPLAERVLLPGDPGRALMLAQLLLQEPRMFNHHRGLWGYTGIAPDGEPMTVQSTGMGGPSAAIVLHELIGLGVKRAIRVGTCGAFRGDEEGSDLERMNSDPLDLGDLLVVREALATDGVSRALGGAEVVAADPGLTGAVELVAGEWGAVAGDAGTERRRIHTGVRVVTTDLFYAPLPSGGGVRAFRPGETRAVAIEMEAAALFTVGGNAGVAVGCVLVVSDLLGPEGSRERIGEDALLEAAEAMGRLAAAALQDT
jgi:uridine phosphorylase